MSDDIKGPKALLETTVERYEVIDEIGYAEPVKESAAMGTVTITDNNEIFLIPSPSADPRDPLNLSPPRKLTFIILVSLFSSIGLAMVSTFGGLLIFYIPIYTAAGASYADITVLMTYPSMFMGVGNLICMPFALAIGRRPVFLGSLLVLVACAIWAAFARDYGEHLGARMMLGFAAGQSEALVPLMIQEIHFVHERSTFLMWQSATQTILSAVLIICASPIAGAIVPSKWYLLGAGLSAFVSVLSVFWVPESRHNRSLAAYGQVAAEKHSKVTPLQVKLSERPALDRIRFPQRTIRSDMRLFVGEVDWMEGLYGFINTFQVLLFPNVLWAFALNGLTIGVNIAIVPSRTSTAGQIVVAFVALPLFGNGSDAVIKWRARRNGGIHKPENRLLLLWIPLTVGVIAATLYGAAAKYPGNFHWFVFVFANAEYYFAFVGANIAAITYLLDSYPARAGPALVTITAFRGFVSFGTSYGIAAFIDKAGYDGTFGPYAALTGVLGLLGVPVFMYGEWIRAYTGRWAMKKATERPSLTH